MVSKSKLISSSLFLAATSLAGVAKADVIPPKVETTAGDGISVADREFRVDNIDLSMGSLTLERFSQSPGRYWPNYSQFGMFMTSNFDIYVQSTFVKATGQPANTIAHYHIIVHIGNKSYGTYRATALTSNNTISAHNTDAYAGTLAWASGNSFKFTDKDGTVYTFRSDISAHPTGRSYGSPGPTSQRVDSVSFANGRTWKFSYDSSQRVKFVEDSSGYAALFDYDSSGFSSDACLIDRSRYFITSSSTCAGQKSTVYYYYGTASSSPLGTVTVLSQFKDVRGQTTSYSRTSSTPSITCVTPPGQSSCRMQLVYDSSGALTQTLADGSVWRFSGGQSAYAVNDPEVPADTSYTTTVTYPDNSTSSYTMAGSSPLSISQPILHSPTITMKWCCSQLQDAYSTATLDGTELIEADYPEGNKYLASYYAPGTISRETYVAKPGSNLPDQVISYEYTDTFSSGQVIRQPTSRTDQNNNVTNWTHTNFGAVQTEMSPAPSSGSARPLKIYDYVSKYAYILNSSGSLAPAAAPIWLPNTITECQTTAGSSVTTCDTSQPVVKTSYEYGADSTVDNLLVRGKVVTSGGVSLRTCYQYDEKGNKIAETSPRAGLSSCA